MLVSKKVWSNNNYGEIHQETSCGFISMWQKMFDICLIIALCSPTQIFSSICRHYMAQHTDFTSHWVWTPSFLAAETMPLLTCGQITRQWAFTSSRVGVWDSAGDMLPMGIKFNTHSCGHCLLLLILEDNKASCMRFIGRWNLCLHSTSCPLDHWSNPGVLITLIGS